MRHIYQHWREHGTGKTGYSVADIIYTADASNDFDTEWYSKERKTLQAAINDAKRYYKKNPDAYFGIYAKATLTDYYDDGTKRYRSFEEEARIGTLHDGEFFDLCEPVDWLP